MTATDELRRMLDERGMEYEANELDLGGGFFNLYTEWSDCSFVEYRDGITLRIFDCTPEQAIAATLGRGECENTSKQPNFECSVCGAYIESEDMFYSLVWIPDAERFIYIDSDPNYCPNCGAKVVGE